MTHKEVVEPRCILREGLPWNLDRKVWAQGLDEYERTIRAKSSFWWGIGHIGTALSWKGGIGQVSAVPGINGMQVHRCGMLDGC